MKFTLFIAVFAGLLAGVGGYFLTPNNADLPDSVKTVKSKVYEDFSVAMDLGGAYDSVNFCKTSNWIEESDIHGRTYVVHTCEYDQKAIDAVNDWNLRMADEVISDRGAQVGDIIVGSSLSPVEKKVAHQRLLDWANAEHDKMATMGVSSIVMESRFLVNKDNTVVPLDPTFSIMSDINPHLNYISKMPYKVAIKNIFADQLNDEIPTDFAKVADDNVIQYTVSNMTQFRLEQQQ